MRTYGRAVCGAPLLLAALASGGVAGAQSAPPAPPPPAIEDIESVDLHSLLNAPVVTASGGREEQRALTSANVHSVSREEITQHGWRSLAEVLANIAGIFVIDDLVLPALSVRGVSGGVYAGTRIVKVMIDGQPVNFRPDLSAFLGPEYIPMEAVERVEVAKGPLSALYGANAFIATVNVVTRTQAKGLGAEVAVRGTVMREGGFGGSALLTHEGAHHDLLLAFSIDQASRSGLTLPRTFPGQDPASPLFGRESAADISTPMSAFARLSVGSERVGTFTLAAGLQQLDSGGEFQVNSVLTGRTRVTFVNIWSQLRYEQSWSKLALAVSSSYSQGDPTRDHRRFLTGSYSSSFTPNSGYNAVDGKIALSYRPLGERLSVRVGFDWSFDRVRGLYFTQTFHQAQGIRQPGDTLDLKAASADTTYDYLGIGAFMQLNSSPLARLPNLHLTANLRIDRITFGLVSFPVEYSWRAAVAYRWSADWTTRLIAGRAFQTPSAVMLFAQPGFGSANNLIGSQTVSGLPTLGPQHVTSVEALASGRLLGRATIELAAYYQEVREKIEFTRQALDFVATNGSARQSIGVEATLRLSYRWFSAYTFASIDEAVTAAGFEGRPTPLYPRGLGMLGVDAHIPRLFVHLNTQVRVVGPRGASQSNVYLNDDQDYEVPTYALRDITLSSVGVHLLSREAETRLVISGRNLLGEQAPEPGFGGIDLPRRSRSFFCELRQIF